MFDSAACCNVTDIKGCVGFVGVAGQFGSAMFILIKWYNNNNGSHFYTAASYLQGWALQDQQKCVL